MRRNHISAPRTCAKTLAAAAVLAALAAPAGLPQTAVADEDSAGEAQAQLPEEAADQSDEAQDGTSQTDAGQAPAAQGLAVTGFCTDWAAADAALQDVEAQNSLAVDVQVENDTDAAQELYDAIDDARSQAGLTPLVRDAELESAAWQRAAEGTLAHSNVRPDGSLFYTVSGRTVAEVLAWGSKADDTSAQALLDTLAGDEDYSSHYSWVLNATNVGCACVSDDEGNVCWALEFSYDNGQAGQANVSSGEATYAVQAAAANVVGIELPERLEMKSGQSVQPTLQATVEGTLWFGSAGYSYDFTGAQVVVETGNFIWNSSNTSVVSATADGTLTALKAGTVTISSTDPDGANPRFGGVVVDGGGSTAKYDLGECTLVGITGDDGKGNFYLNDQGGVTIPAFSVMAPDGTVIDPVNYVATINYNERTSVAVLTVKANSKSELCSGIATKQLHVVDPAAQTAQEDDSASGAAVGDGTEGAATADGTDGAGTGGDTQGDTGTEAAGAMADSDGTGEVADGSDAQGAQDESASTQGDSLPADVGATGEAGSSDTNGETGADSSDGTTGTASGSAETVKTAKSIESGQLTLSFASLTYTGSPITATNATVSLDGTELVEGTDFTVAYTDNVAAGTATATATGIGAYTGTLSTTFDISAADLRQARVTMPNLVYTGGALTPQPTSVTYEAGGTTCALEQDVDYRIAGYTNNTNVGDATIVLQGMGNFTGMLIANWKVVAQGTENAGVTQTIPQTADMTDTGSMLALGLAGMGGCAAAAILLVRSRRRGNASSTPTER